MIYFLELESPLNVISAKKNGKEMLRGEKNCNIGSIGCSRMDQHRESRIAMYWNRASTK